MKAKHKIKSLDFLCDPDYMDSSFYKCCYTACPADAIENDRVSMFEFRIQTEEALLEMTDISQYEFDAMLDMQLDTIRAHHN